MTRQSLLLPVLLGLLFVCACTPQEPSTPTAPRPSPEEDPRSRLWSIQQWAGSLKLVLDPHRLVEGRPRLIQARVQWLLPVRGSRRTAHHHRYHRHPAANLPHVGSFHQLLEPVSR